MALAYIGLGGNVGDARSYIEKATEELKKLGKLHATSSLYRTEPVGLPNQGWFLNAAVVLETTFLPEDLLQKFKKIEKELGRTPTSQSGPREIDLDLLLYDEMVMQTKTLTVPHPRMHERAFVLLPLSEIAPEVTHPLLKKTIVEILATIANTHICEKIS